MEHTKLGPTPFSGHRRTTTFPATRCSNGETEFTKAKKLIRPGGGGGRWRRMRTGVPFCGSSMISDEALLVMEDEDDVEVSDPSWFYLTSMTVSFGSGSGLPGKAFATYKPVWITGSELILGSGCDRAKTGGEFGLQTIVCIPLDNGVLELGCTAEIQQTPDLLNKIRVIFSFEGS